MVVSELRGEKIDIIPWNTEPARFIAKALSPARVREVFVDDETKEATVVVPEDQLALAIGKEGLNARLAARLTGWRVDIQSDQEFAQAEAEAAFAGDEEGGGEFSGRCAAILANGKRCPNASLPGSRFCGIPAHQELAAREAAGEKVASVPIAAEGEASSDEVSDTMSEPEAPVAEAEADPAADEEILVEATPEVGEPVHETAPVGDADEGPGPEPEVEVPVPGQETEEEQGSS
jgi:transcription termination/antitermination protein NusA